jgi:hypothetical protein
MDTNPWNHKWSESRSEMFGSLGMKEPMNALSALFMGLYVLSDMLQTTQPINKLLKASIIINLGASFVAHATYNRTAIKLDGLSMTIPLLLLAIYYKDYLVALGLFLFLFTSTSADFTLGLLYILYISRGKLKNHTKVSCAILLILVSTLLWWIDQSSDIIESYWYVNLHSVWHIGCAYGLLILIDQIQW